MPILGTIASSRLKTPPAIPAYFQIMTATVSGTANHTFTSIPQDYDHLQLRIFSKDNRSPVYSGIEIRYNGDSAQNYWWSFPDVATTQVPTFGNYNNSTADSAIIANIPGGSSSNYWGSSWTTIFNYRNTSMWKYTNGVGGYNADGDGSFGGFVMQPGTVWRNTSAITQILVRSNTSSNFQSGTRISLYGIKGS